MKQPKSPKITKLRKLPEAGLGDLASSIHAALALAHASGEPLPKSLAQKFYARVEAELETIAEHSEETAEA